MKKIFYQTWGKIAAAVLCILCMNVMIVSLAVMLMGEQYGIYETSEEEFQNQVNQEICRKYSIEAAIAYYFDYKDRLGKLSESNFRFGVIQTGSIDGLILSDRKIYGFCNFEDSDMAVTKDTSSVHSYSLGDGTSFQTARFLFDEAYVSNEPTYNVRAEVIEGAYYVRDLGKFYCYANQTLYPISVDTDKSMRELIIKNEKDGGYDWADPNGWIQHNGQVYYLEDIPIVLNKELSGIGKVVSDQVESPSYVDYQIEDGNVVKYEYSIKNTKPYYVLSYVADPLTFSVNGKAFTEEEYYRQNIFWQLLHMGELDFFGQANVLIHLAYAMRYGALGSFTISLGVFLFLFAGLLAGAGHRRSKEMAMGYAEKIPTDLFLLAMSILLLWIEISGAYCISFFQNRFSLAAGIMLVILGQLVGLFACMSVAVRIKLRIFWKNTLICKLWLFLSGGVKKSIEKANQSVPLMWKAWFVMAALAVLEWFGMAVTSYRTGILMVMWLMEKAALYTGITLCLLQMKKLQQMGEQLAKGELDSRVDTGRMFWDFKKHGENLNHIREGIHRAVAEQMKSERFKTELITNVSHDIKTPLTSIISYIDLLEKTKTDNPETAEYLEVLGRQSLRLKKLIEDLMEVSKASTCNLAVEWETCNAQVMLTQTLGEFEEKLKSGQIELIVKECREAATISADPKHLWRIFENLMNNICKYAQPSTRAYVNIEKKQNKVSIIFRNVSKYELNMDSEELMERFVRGDSSRNTEGSGLGLSIAKSLTELMRGQFEIVVDGDLFKVIVTFLALE